MRQIGGVLGLILLGTSLALAEAPITVRVTEATQAALVAALAKVSPTGGVVELSPGVYTLRSRVRVPSNITLRGPLTGEVVLQLPSPTTITAAAPAGASTLTVADATSFTAGSRVDLAPPPSADDKHTRPHEDAHLITAVNGATLTLAAPLKHDVPAGSRLGYFENMLSVYSARNVTIENITFDGGRTAATHMPGHQFRSGIWAAARFSYDSGPTEPPTTNLVIRRCTFRRLYGRGVALYNVADTQVIDCRFTDINDEAIDLDHFTFRCLVRGNVVEDAVTGVTINDGSENLVELNTLTRCGVGVKIWRYERFQQPEVNRRNVIQHNTIASRGKVDISVGTNCRENIVRANHVAGEIVAADTSTVVENNTRTGEPRRPGR